MHKVYVQSHAIRLQEWRIESDKYSYIELYKDVCNEFLGTTFMEREVEISVNAHI